MPLHVEPLASTVRWYSSEGGYERREPFDAVCTLVWMGPETVFISGLHGKMSRARWRELRDWLIGHGVDEASMLRRGRRITLSLFPNR